MRFYYCLIVLTLVSGPLIAAEHSDSNKPTQLRVNTAGLDAQLPQQTHEKLSPANKQKIKSSMLHRELLAMDDNFNTKCYLAAVTSTLLWTAVSFWAAGK